MDRVRALFETNVFGAARLTQLVLPGMRSRGSGRIVTIGSMNGRFTWPGTGYYCATKHALEAISDALRHEVRPFGIDVVLIEPGFVKTPLGETAAHRRTDDDGGPYATYNAAVAEVATTYTTGMLGTLACTSEAVAEDRREGALRRRAPRPLPRGALRRAVHDDAQAAAGRRPSTRSCARRCRRLNVPSEEVRDLVAAL